MSINVLILCQRYQGTRTFNKDNVLSIDKDIEYLINLNSLDTLDNDIIIKDYLTTGLGHIDDRMTFNIDFDYKNKETIDFVEEHLNHYNFIVIGTCPFTVFNDNNVKLLSNILKQGGQIIINPSDRKASFNIWIEHTIKSFEKFFNIIEQKPKFIMRKKSEKRKNSSNNSDPKLKKGKTRQTAIVIDDDDDDEKIGGYEFGKVKSKDKKIGSLFNEIETGGGGSCLFTSLAYILGIEKKDKQDDSILQKNSKKIRKQIFKYNPPDLSPFVSIGEGERSMCNKKT